MTLFKLLIRMCELKIRLFRTPLAGQLEVSEGEDVLLPLSVLVSANELLKSKHKPQQHPPCYD